MTPLEALQLLDNAVSQLSMTRENHIKVTNAVEILLKEITPSQVKSLDLVKEED